MRASSRWTALLVVAALGACDDSTGLGEGDPPVLPDVESMTFDFDFFAEGGAGAAAAPARVAGVNWAAAALSVSVANLAVVLHTAVPVATWTAARAQQPTFEDGQWHWAFSTTQGEQSYSGDLAGYLDGNDAVFEMRVSSSLLQLEDFLWYTGRGEVGSNAGVWTFYHPEFGTTAVGEISWSHPTDDTWTLTFSATAGSQEGDELEYAIDGTSRTVTFFDASDERTSEIHWDQQTHVGYIIAPNYNEGQKACWDGTLANTPCVVS